MTTEPTKHESYDPGIEEPPKDTKGIGTRIEKVKPPKPKRITKPKPKK